MLHGKSQWLASLAIFMLTASGLAGCSQLNTSSHTSANASVAASDLFVRLANYSSADLDSSWDTSGATRIDLNGAGASVQGSGATLSGQTVTIFAAGTYVVQGDLNDGQLIVAAGDKDTVHLVLNGTSLACSYGSPLCIEKADKAIITLAAGTTNTISDAAVYKNTSGDDSPDAAIFSRCDLTMNGTGSLVVSGNYQNGIDTRDDLKIVSGNIQVTAIGDGIRGRDSVTIKDGSFTIVTGADGIQSNNDQDSNQGWVAIEGGSFNIESQLDAIQAESILQVSGGSFNLTSGGGSAAATPAIAAAPGSRAASSTSAQEDTDSAKALKGTAGIGISGGTFFIDSADDAIHSNGAVYIKGGNFAVSTGDDAIHADSQVTIDAGKIDVAKCYEGLEGAYIATGGGEIRLSASDDGINAAGGNDSSGMQQGQDQFSTAGNYEIRITSGYIYISACGDGIDSNGALNITGGAIIVNGPTSNGDGPLDYNGSASISGGVLVAVGSAGMAQAPQASSSQNSLLVIYSSVQKAGTLVDLADASGNSLVTFAPNKNYQSVVISTPSLQQGQTYTLSSGGTSTGRQVDGLYSGGDYSNGTKLTTVTLSSHLTSISDDGSAATSSGGGPQHGAGGPSRTPPRT